ncbi:hypothetical protein [Achromobacter phage Motura]|uniref:Uncharacterized protein n=1 Tax=Achromobacter phage Motura TaxID=2591403 RepID=A0A514CSR3_9CAUD|nr:hypothetical protein H1O15_gp294 [Achromobacter phage Motura]QDH83512.1 hypothetical protein [Achromobacter phage Motura]
MKKAPKTPRTSSALRKQKETAADYAARDVWPYLVRLTGATARIECYSDDSILEKLEAGVKGKEFTIVAGPKDAFHNGFNLSNVLQVVTEVGGHHIWPPLAKKPATKTAQVTFTIETYSLGTFQYQAECIDQLLELLSDEGVFPSDCSLNNDGDDVDVADMDEDDLAVSLSDVKAIRAAGLTVWENSKPQRAKKVRRPAVTSEGASEIELKRWFDLGTGEFFDYRDNPQYRAILNLKRQTFKSLVYNILTGSRCKVETEIDGFQIKVGEPYEDVDGHLAVDGRLFAAHYDVAGVTMSFALGQGVEGKSWVKCAEDQTDNSGEASQSLYSKGRSLEIDMETLMAEFLPKTKAWF